MAEEIRTDQIQEGAMRRLEELHRLHPVTVFHSLETEEQLYVLFLNTIVLALRTERGRGVVRRSEVWDRICLANPRIRELSYARRRFDRTWDEVVRIIERNG